MVTVPAAAASSGTAASAVAVAVDSNERQAVRSLLANLAAFTFTQVHLEELTAIINDESPSMDPAEDGEHEGNVRLFERLSALMPMDAVTAVRALAFAMIDAAPSSDQPRLVMISGPQCSGKSSATDLVLRALGTSKDACASGSLDVLVSAFPGFAQLNGHVGMHREPVRRRERQSLLFHTIVGARGFGLRCVNQQARERALEQRKSLLIETTCFAHHLFAAPRRGEAHRTSRTKQFAREGYDIILAVLWCPLQELHRRGVERTEQGYNAAVAEHDYLSNIEHLPLALFHADVKIVYALESSVAGGTARIVFELVRSDEPTVRLDDSPLDIELRGLLQSIANAFDQGARARARTLSGHAHGTNAPPQLQELEC